MQLLVVRHAIAADLTEAGVGSDAARPLTERGIRRMRKGARGLARLLPPPDLIVSSNLVRAVETAALVAEAFPGAPDPVADPILGPGPSPREVAAWVAERDRTGIERLVLVGHEPGCSALVAHLVGAPRGDAFAFDKGGAALLEVGASGRDDLRGTLVWLATPKVLRRAR